MLLIFIIVSIGQRLENTHLVLTSGRLVLQKLAKNCPHLHQSFHYLKIEMVDKFNLHILNFYTPT